MFIESALIEVIVLLVTFFLLFYFYVKWSYNYWERIGIATYQTPTFPFGHFGPVIRQRVNGSLLFSNIYRQTTGALIGTYSFLKPILVVRDPRILHAIIIKDFQHFRDRGVFSNEKTDPLTGNLFNMNGDKWKSLRAQLTPTFTTGKLKAMFSTLVHCGDSLNKFMDKAADTEKTLEMREIMAQYTTNIITSVAFGLDVDAISDPETPFRKIGRKIFGITTRQMLIITVSFFFPNLFKRLNIKTMDPEVEDFIISMVKQNMDYREKNNVVRKDFFQLLLQLRNTGKVQMDGEWETKIVQNDSEKKFSINQCAAQAFVFFLAGFETSSTTMSYTLYELAKNATIQKKVQKEIDETLKKHNGEITYAAVQEMKYLESCIDGMNKKKIL